MKGRARLRLSATIGALVICVVLAVTPAASGAEFSFRACSPEAPVTDQQATALGLNGKSWAPFAISGTCPDGLTFDSSSAASGGETGYWYAIAPGGMKIDRFSMVVQGGDAAGGVQYTVEGCAAKCTTLGSLPVPPTGESQFVQFDYGLGSVIQIRATCTEPTCPAGDSLRFRDLVLATHDDKAPRAYFESMPIKWIKRQAFNGAFNISDWPGVGVGWYAARIDETTPLPAYTGCEMAMPVPALGSFPLTLPCPAETGTRKITSNFASLPDGQHTITLHAVDAAGNPTTPVTASFKLDDTPPGDPTNAAVSKLSHGWSSNNLVTISWFNPTETYESPTQSGLYSIHSLLVPRGSPQSSGVPATYWPFSVGAFQTVLRDFVIPSDGSWDFYVWTDDVAGNTSGKLKLEFGLDRDVPAAPELGENPWVSRDAILKGYRQTWSQPPSPDLESGICDYAVDFRPTLEAVGTSMKESGTATSALVPSTTPSGINRVTVRAVSCAGIESPPASTQLRVDGSSPTVEASGIPQDIWSTSQARIVLSASDAESGVDRIEYSLDDEPTASAPGPTVNIPIESGAHTLRYSATDVAGNRSTEFVREIRTDSIVPIAKIGGFDASHPSRLHATASDSGSGVAHAQFQLRRVDAGGFEWSALPTASHPLDDSTGRITLSAEVPDDKLDKGTYAVRLIVTDIAGNVAIADRLDGSDRPLLLQLPLREQLKLTSKLAVISKRCADVDGRRCTRAICRSKRADCRQREFVDTKGALTSTTVRYSQRVELIGSLTDSGDRPLAGLRLEIYSEDVNADGVTQARAKLGVAETDRRGLVRLRVPEGPNRRLVVRFAGSETKLPTETYSDLGVEAGASLMARRSTVHVGDWIELRGRLRTHGYPGSPARVNVILSFWNGHSWQTGMGRTKTDTLGRFAIPYLTKNPSRLRVRAEVAAAGSAWPFMDGVSNSVTVKILR